MSAILAVPPRRIAVLRALHLGDLLLAVPALRALRAGFPGAEITLIGLPWATAFARRVDRYLDRFVPFDGYPGIAEVPVDPARTARFVADQRAVGYDLVIQMHGSGRTSNACALALSGRVTAGYYDGTRPAGLDIGAPYPDDCSEIERNLRLARLLGCPDLGPALEFPLSAADRAEAAALLDRPPPGGPLVGIHPGARYPARRWPPERFAAVGDLLAERYGARIVLTGSTEEVATVQQVAAAMRAAPLVLAGRTSLGGLAALIARLDLFISNDTGPAHIADALGTPSVTLFGPADPTRWGPLDRERHPVVRVPVACSPCPHRECPIDHRCLHRITPEMVATAATRLLAAGAMACDD
ncbi:glycosyltransferase family 9 protein [Sphaerobacter sp.]|uniref:glycosyltransferase family 9 protein n=1 Tax=Sphaerobacter sp. TaxID=2099654 RepID=UPI001D5D3D53|nr:glycosyltransferase family 9 protein [Sphaerobacter sp.]MBX5445512.1 glycosyltransferase family 9 protein [Sphaerobacter sp.]